MPDVSIEPSESGGNIVLGVVGSVDHTNADIFRDLLLIPMEAAFDAGTPVIVDMSGLEYISSAGLRIFMIASKTTKAKDARIALAGWSETTKEIFTISRFNLILDCFDTMAEAEAKLAEG